MQRWVVAVGLLLGAALLAAPGTLAYQYTGPEPPQPPTPPEPEPPADPAAGTNECFKVNGWRYCVSYKAYDECDLYIYFGSLIVGCVVEDMPV